MTTAFTGVKNEKVEQEFYQQEGRRPECDGVE
jgi:hypothetical protein